MAARISLFLEDEAATARFGNDLAAALRPGDVVALEGDLGAGKTALARAVIRSLCRAPDLDVPSPTFTLVQDYEGRFPVRHFDLYRLGDPDELDELGFDAEDEGLALVEWPERAGDRLPAGAIRIALAEEEGGRRVTVSASDADLFRIGRSLAIRAFLKRAGAGAALRHYLQGDASARAYERIFEPGRTGRILMDAPRQPDGPPIRDGMPYSRIARLAEDVTPFLAVDLALRAQGFCAPRIDAHDLDAGLLLIEDLGPTPFLADGRPVAERYESAARLLAEIHKVEWSPGLPLPDGGTYRVPPYDRAAMEIETELFLDWYCLHQAGVSPTDEMRLAHRAAWDAVFDTLDEVGERTLVLRDFHSPNLIWREERRDRHRIGLIDFQDAVMGPSAYDLASLAMDARVDIEPGLEAAIFEAYCAARGEALDRPALEAAYAIMAAQRNAKILGIFVRLNVRDGKPGYLRHLPRIRDYLGRALAHPALEPVSRFHREAGLFEAA